MEDVISITRTTYRVSDFLSWQRQGALDLRPPFQRGSVWSAKAKSFFIDSIVRGYPVPLVFLQDRTDPKTFEPTRLVVDGQQRLRTVLGYIDEKCLKDRDESDAFAVLKTHNAELAGKAFKQLPSSVQERILQFEFSVHVLPPATANSVLLEIFARMNATGTRLNEQELRNAEFSGAFKQLAYALSYQELDRWLRWGLFTKPQVARMLNVELMSELLMYLLDGLTSKSQSAIRKTYETYDDGVAHEKALTMRCESVLDAIDEIYGSFTGLGGVTEFSRTPFNGQGWFYVLFAFVHDLGFEATVNARASAKAKALPIAKIKRHLNRKADSLKSDALDDTLLKALRGAATDKASRQARYAFLREGFRG
jgi:hypothetical protein